MITMTPYIVAIAHPSLDRLVDPFADELRSEPRRFGRLAAANPKPFPSLVAKIVTNDRYRFGAVDDGHLVAMASLAIDGDVAMAVTQSHRGRGIGSMLMVHAVDVADRFGVGRLRMESSRRSTAVAALAVRHGWTVVDIGSGRIDVLHDRAEHGVVGHGVG